MLLRRVSAGQILYSAHQLSFVVADLPDATPVHFNPQEYTDFAELRALCDLLGPYGVKFMAERLMWHVASQIQEMKASAGTRFALEAGVCRNSWCRIRRCCGDCARVLTSRTV